MSIETLLEAAKFLEWQALQQQKTREEDELREKLRLSQEAEQKRAEVASLVQPVGFNHVTWAGKFCPEPCPTPVAPPSVPPSVPITVIPIPVLSASPQLLPTPSVTALAPPTDSQPSPPPALPPAPPPQHQHLQPSSQVKGESATLPQTPNPKQLLYPGPAPPASQHAPLPQPVPAQAPPSPALRPAATDDPRNMDAKKRPGGAGTREVHNKLEKNRRAHLKECFETLKKTVPTVDEKKTSNLSVLRSALRYIQTLKRKEKEYEHEMERLAREKISTQQRLADLKNELGQWMNAMEMERVLRLTVQPEDDQASTSTASEGEDNVDEDAEEDHQQPPSKIPHLDTATPNSIPVQHQPPQPLVQIPTAPPAQSHAHTHVVPAPSMPSVIAHASVIQAGSKHVAHLVPSPAPQAVGPAPQAVGPAPSPAPQAIGHAPKAIGPAPSPAPQAIGSAPQSISHITVHPVAHLYPPTAMMSHLAHTLSHAQVNTLTPAQINTLSHAQVNTLSPAQINTLSHAQINTLTHAPVSTLSHTQVNTLSPAQINTLSHAQINTLAPAQVNTLSHTQVNTLSPAQINTLSHAQINTLAPAPVSTLSHTQVNTLAHAPVSTLSHTQVNTLSPAQVNTLSHAQVNCQPAVVTHHSQLVGQAVLNPVTMVTMPSFPVSRLKLA